MERWVRNQRPGVGRRKSQGFGSCSST
jgi:hypothetical protein